MSPRRARRLPGDVPRRRRGGGSPGPRGPGAGDAGPGGGGGLDGDDSGPRSPLGPERHESWPDGDWVVRLVPGTASVKSYRCPGCDQEITPGLPHLVAWPTLIPGPTERRHWHRPCWYRRMQRRPGRRVGR